MAGFIEQTTDRGLCYFGRMCRCYCQIPWLSSFKILLIGSFIVTLFFQDVNIDRYKILDIRY